MEWRSCFQGRLVIKILNIPIVLLSVLFPVAISAASLGGVSSESSKILNSENYMVVKKNMKEGE